MAKANPSATEAPPLPPTEEPVSEPVEAPVEEPIVEEPAAPLVQEEEKPDIVAQVKGLPDEERERVLLEAYSDRLQRLEQSAYDKAVARIQSEENRRRQEYGNIQSVLQGLENVVDETQRAQMIYSYGQSREADAVRRQSEADSDYIKEQIVQPVFGLNGAQFDVVWDEVRKEAANSGRKAEWPDLFRRLLGEKFMPKSEAGKLSEEKIAAMVEEAVGKRLAGQPTPVTLGPAEAAASEEQHDKIMTTGSIEERRAEFKRAHGFDPPF